MASPLITTTSPRRPSQIYLPSLVPPPPTFHLSCSLLLLGKIALPAQVKATVAISCIVKVVSSTVPPLYLTPLLSPLLKANTRLLLLEPLLANALDNYLKSYTDWIQMPLSPFLSSPAPRVPWLWSPATATATATLTLLKVVSPY